MSSKQISLFLLVIFLLIIDDVDCGGGGDSDGSFDWGSSQQLIT